jgi:DNA-binding protein HU-beta
MTKAELIERVYEQAGEGLSRRLTAEIVENIFDTIALSLERDARFAVPAFGTFTLKTRAARKGRNPQTGAEIDIPASKAVQFKAAAALKGDL